MLSAKPPSESNLIIYLINGSEIHVLGMDKPERIEGTPLLPTIDIKQEAK
jgi:hypothetical protein